MAEKERSSQSFELDERSGPADPVLPTTNPDSEKPAPEKPGLHPAFYIATWITLSSSTILFNKWILSTAEFHYPILLTSWHLGFATLMTQLLARFTKVLDSRKKVPMTGRVYLRSIVPIGLMFSLSLICGNLAYLYLSVSFIQMLKATMPVVTLVTSWAMRVSEPNMKTLANVSLIVVGVMIASVGELQFVLIGFLFQCGGIIFEAMRLVMVQQLLSGAEFKMDPLVSLYYFAPICAIMNGLIAAVVEVPKIKFVEVQNVGFSLFILNAMIAFLLNVSVVFLIGKTSSLVMTLSGVLKDILLVVASMLIFRDPVSGLQAFGYTVALCGLVYYKLGADNLKDYLSHGQRRWAEFGANRPIARRLVTIGLSVFTLLFILAAVGSTGVAGDKLNAVKAVQDKFAGWGTFGGS